MVGKANPKNPGPNYVGLVPPKEAFVFRQPIFMPSTNKRPLLSFEGNLYR